MTQELHVRLLGTFHLAYDGEAPTTVDTPRLRSLLAYLLLYREAPQPRHHLAFRFWPDSTDAQACTNLRKQLYHLRRALPDPDRFLHEIAGLFGIAIVLHNLGLVAYERGTYVEAARYVEESLAIRRDIDDRRGLATSLNTLGQIRVAQGARDEAEDLFRDALTTALAIRYVPGALDVLVRIAGLFLARGRKEPAVDLLSFVWHHPRSERSTKDRAVQYLDTLAGGPPRCDEGTQRPLEEIVAEIVNDKLDADKRR